jgi:hypothetical protein
MACNSKVIYLITGNNFCSALKNNPQIMRRDRKPIPEALLEYLEPVKPYIGNDPVEKETLIQRCAGCVEQPVLNFLKLFSFIEMSKMDNGQLIIV